MDKGNNSASIVASECIDAASPLLDFWKGKIQLISRGFTIPSALSPLDSGKASVCWHVSVAPSLIHSLMKHEFGLEVGAPWPGTRYLCFERREGGNA